MAKKRIRFVEGQWQDSDYGTPMRKLDRKTDIPALLAYLLQIQARMVRGNSQNNDNK